MNFFNKVLKPFHVQLNRTKSLNNEKAYYENTIKRLSHFYQDFIGKFQSDLNTDISGIVFSRDRAMQLHALLSSYFYYTKNPASLIILFTYSNEQHKQAYKILQKEFQTFPVSFVAETDFAIQLKEIVNNMKADRIFFMTDDGVFLDHYDLSDCLNFDPIDNIFSLRLGSDFDFCYSHNKRQALPEFVQQNINGQDFNSWKWEEMKDSPDWIYPLSVDATIFLKKEVETILNAILFKSPNSLESQMQLYNDLFIQRQGICFSKAKYVNIPCNIVQNEFNNLHTGTYNVNELLDRFLKRQRIDWKILKNLRAPEAQVAKFTFIDQCL